MFTFVAHGGRSNRMARGKSDQVMARPPANRLIKPVAAAASSIDGHADPLVLDNTRFLFCQINHIDSKFEE